MAESERLHHERLRIGEDREFRCRYLHRPRQQRRRFFSAEELQAHRESADAVPIRLFQPVQPSAIPGKCPQRGVELHCPEHCRPSRIQGCRWQWDHEYRQRSLYPEYDLESWHLRLRNAIPREWMAPIAVRSEIYLLTVLTT